MKIKPLKSFRAEVTVPPDKSVTQRAVIIGAFNGGAQVENPSLSGDVLSALRCVEELGAKIDSCGNVLNISPISPRHNFGKPVLLNAGNSATAMRLIAGAAVGAGIAVKITGDKSLLARDMSEVIAALRSIGGDICGKSAQINGEEKIFPPLIILPSKITGGEYNIKNPSAQTKSALLLAALNSEKTAVSEAPTRDHTEVMLKSAGADITEEYAHGKKIITVKKSTLKKIKTTVYGDFSSAAYPIALALMIDGGSVVIKNVGLDFLRTGMLRVLIDSGADISVFVCGKPYDIFTRQDSGIFGDITIKNSPLTALKVTKEQIPSLIDEIPVLAAIACFAEGKSVFDGLAALKNKESDRLVQTCNLIEQFGFKSQIKGDTLTVFGGDKGQKNPPLITQNDHRMVMTAAVLAAATIGCKITNAKAAAVSYPDFFSLFK